jgi:5-methylcytosine-specific restriction endonuclease McrA
MTKVEAIKELLKERGAPAPWDYIYENMERFYPSAKASREWKAGIRGVLYREIKNGRNFKRVAYGLYALQDYQEAEMIEDEVEKPVNKAKILKEAQAFATAKPSHVMRTSPHKVRLESSTQKKRVAKLEDYSCQICDWFVEYVNSKGKKVRSITVDHIIEKSTGTGEELNNLWALCPNCHYQKTLRVITVDIEKKKVFKNGKEISLKHDNHLGW